MATIQYEYREIPDLGTGGDIHLAGGKLLKTASTVHHATQNDSFTADDVYDAGQGRYRFVFWNVRRAPARSLDLGSRVRHYLLLVLARRRLADRAAGVPAGEQGWLRHDDLLRMLRVDDNHLNIMIHRARAQLREHGVADAAALVERRTTAHQLRIGVDRLELRPIDRPAPAHASP